MSRLLVFATFGAILLSRLSGETRWAGDANLSPRIGIFLEFDREPPPDAIQEMEREVGALLAETGARFSWLMTLPRLAHPACIWIAPDSSLGRNCARRLPFRARVELLLKPEDQKGLSRFGQLPPWRIGSYSLGQLRHRCEKNCASCLYLDGLSARLHPISCLVNSFWPWTSVRR
jgi:hypothetical protein